MLTKCKLTVQISHCLLNVDMCVKYLYQCVIILILDFDEK